MTARTSDPATSHLAATYIAGKRPGLKDAFLQALKVLGPSTANEIAQWCVQSGVSANAESVRKRALDVVRDGVCEWSDARACKITGLNARTVRLTTGEILRRPPESNIEAERIQAVAEFVKSEREWVAIFKVAVELAGLSKVGTWPKGDSNEYIVAIESAALMGLIERAGSNVRRKREVVETKAVQGSLFE